MTHILYRFETSSNENCYFYATLVESSSKQIIRQNNQQASRSDKNSFSLSSEKSSIVRFHCTTTNVHRNTLTFVLSTNFRGRDYLRTDHEGLMNLPSRIENNQFHPRAVLRVSALAINCNFRLTISDRWPYERRRREFWNFGHAYWSKSPLAALIANNPANECLRSSCVICPPLTPNNSPLKCVTKTNAPRFFLHARLWFSVNGQVACREPRNIL